MSPVPKHNLHNIISRKGMGDRVSHPVRKVVTEAEDLFWVNMVVSPISQAEIFIC